MFFSPSNAAIVNEFAVYICAIGYCETRRYCALINQRYAIYDRAEIDYTPYSSGSLVRSLFNIEPVTRLLHFASKRSSTDGVCSVLALYREDPNLFHNWFAIARERATS